MKIEECYGELQAEKWRHQQTMKYYHELRLLYYKETGIDFIPMDIDPNQVKPGYYRRFGRVVWPLNKFVS